MDDRSRIIQLEAEMKAMHEGNTRLERFISCLHGDVIALRGHVEEKFEKQRDYVDDKFEKLIARIDEEQAYFDQRFAEERSWSESNFKDIRDRMERGFTECRNDSKATRHWLIGIAVSIALGVAGIVAKILYFA